MKWAHPGAPWRNKKEKKNLQARVPSHPLMGPTTLPSSATEISSVAPSHNSSVSPRGMQHESENSCASQWWNTCDDEHPDTGGCNRAPCHEAVCALGRRCQHRPLLLRPRKLRPGLASSEATPKWWAAKRAPLSYRCTLSSVPDCPPDVHSLSGFRDWHALRNSIRT